MEKKKITCWLSTTILNARDHEIKTFKAFQKAISIKKRVMLAAWCDFKEIF